MEAPVTRWEQVRRWRDALRSVDIPLDTGLSRKGAIEAINTALDALDDRALDAIASLKVDGFETATVVAARTVFTAPLELIAVLLGRGSKVTVKTPSGQPGLMPAASRVAKRLGLELNHTSHRDLDADLVIAMGSDETIAALRSSLPARTRFVGFGHRFSVAWLTQTASADGIARDIAMHDTRGCMSPVAVFTPDARIMAEALDRALTEISWPRGDLAPAEGARIRTDIARARILGSAHVGPDHAIFVLPTDRFNPHAGPRTIAVHQVDSLDQVCRALTPWSQHLSTVGTDDPTALQRLLATGAHRVCGPGEMQRPPLRRAHDGVDWQLIGPTDR